MAIQNDLIFDFWATAEPTDAVHPADHPVLDRMDAGELILDRYLPQPFIGPLRAAKIVLLYLSPGTSSSDKNELESKIEIERCARQRQGYEPLPGKAEHFNAWRWWSSRVEWMGDPESLRSKVAILELGAYHSINGYQSLLLALPSSRVAVEWAQSILFPEGMSGKKLLLCLRSPKYWGLSAGRQYGSALFAPITTRNGYVQGKEVRERIGAIAKSFLV